MKKTNQAPHHFARCLNDGCPQANECMRRLAALNEPAKEKEIRVINPQCLPTDDEACPHFRAIDKVRVAWGIRHLYDRIPYPVAKRLKAQLIEHFGRGRYYRFYRQEYGLQPEEQTYITALFTRWGIVEPPVFERYSEEYCY